MIRHGVFEVTSVGKTQYYFAEDIGGAQDVLLMAVTMTEAGGLDDVLLGTSLEGPHLSISSLRAELEMVRTALQAEQAHSPTVDKAIQNNVPEMEM